MNTFQIIKEKQKKFKTMFKFWLTWLEFAAFQKREVFRKQLWVQLIDDMIS